MKISIDQKNKIIKSFCVVGLKEEQLNYYNDDIKSNLYIKNIDVLVKKISTNKNIYIKDDEKWYRVIKGGDTWFRMQTTKEYNNPITDFKIIGCRYDEKENCLLMDKRHFKAKYYPIRPTIINDNTDDKNVNNDNDEREKLRILDEYIPDNFQEFKEDNNLVKIPKEFNLKDIMNLPIKNNAGVILVSREYNNLPLKAIQIQHLKDNNYQFKRSKNKSPFLNKYNPEVIDQYPPSDHINNSVAMFCFPEGINILEKKPSPKKFNFILTDEVGERTYGSVLIFWEKLKDNLRKSIEPFYDEIVEKTKEEIEIEIKENEEKGEKDKEIKATKLKDYYTPKALCILSKFPFFSNNIIFLKELYKIFNSSSTKIPLERVICGYVDSLYKQSYDKIIRFNIRNENIDFYFLPYYGKDWDINDKYLETLFRVLSKDIITTAWQGLLLEKKLFLICSSKETLLQVCHSFVTLLFPFKWIHTYIPILPEKLKAFIESPLPLIFGISFSIDINDLPDDSLIININQNIFEKNEEGTPKLTGKLKNVLEKKLNRLKEKYQIEKPTDSHIWMDYLDEVEPKTIPENINTIDCGEIRDAFYDVFIYMFKNYSKYFIWDKEKGKKTQKEENENEEEEVPIEFKREIFLKDHGSSDDGSFLSMFCDTALFSQFISSISLIQHDASLKYFFECIKKGRGKNKVFLPNIIPEEVIYAEKIKIDDLEKKDYFYGIFPKLDPKLYIKYEAPTKPYRPKFVFQNDEWCYNPMKLVKRDWPKYFLYLIYEIWYNFFSFSINFYAKERLEPLMNYAINLLQDLINQKKITPTKNLFSKMFKACGRSGLSPYIKQILELANKVYSKSGTNLFQNAYLNGLYALSGNINQNSTITMSLNNSTFNNISSKKSIMDEITSYNKVDFSYFDDFIFLTQKYCPFCTKNIQKIKFITIEELFAGFNKNINKFDSICPNCLTVVSSNIYYLLKSQKKVELQQFNLYTPMKILKEIEDINKNMGEYIFYLTNKLESPKIKELYINIIFYFKLFDLPLFVLYIENEQKNFEENILKDLEDNIFRKNSPKKKRTKDGFGLSPDKRGKMSLDTSDDNKSLSGTGVPTKDSFSLVSGKSGSSTGIAYMEKELWKDLILKNIDKIVLTGDKIGTEDRNALLSRIKYMKAVLSNITSYFVSFYKEKLEEYLIDSEFYNEIKGKESLNSNSNVETAVNSEINVGKNPFNDDKNKKIHRNRPQSCDRKKYEGFSSDNYNKKHNINNYYDSNAFDAIINENRKDIDIKSDRNINKIPSGFNQINQLNDPNDNKSKGFGNTFKKFFSFGTKKKNANNDNRESK